MALKPSAPARLPANVTAIRRAIRDVGIFGGAREFRIDGVRGLVLLAPPSGTATWYLHYDVAVARKRRRRKLKIGRLDDSRWQMPSPWPRANDQPSARAPIRSPGDRANGMS